MINTILNIFDPPPSPIVTLFFYWGLCTFVTISLTPLRPWSHLWTTPYLKIHVHDGIAKFVCSSLQFLFRFLCGSDDLQFFVHRNNSQFGVLQSETENCFFQLKSLLKRYNTVNDDFLLHVNWNSIFWSWLKPKNGAQNTSEWWKLKFLTIFLLAYL